MRNHKIELPEGCDKDDVVIAFFNSAEMMRNKDYPTLGVLRSDYAIAIDEMNPEPADVDLTEVGAVCHCDQRDAHEIAVYFTPDELLAVKACLDDVTMGSMPDGHTTLNLWKAMQEIDDVVEDRTGGPSLR